MCLLRLKYTRMRKQARHCHPLSMFALGETSVHVGGRVCADPAVVVLIIIDVVLAIIVVSTIVELSPAYGLSNSVEVVKIVGVVATSGSAFAGQDHAAEIVGIELEKRKFAVQSIV